MTPVQTVYDNNGVGATSRTLTFASPVSAGETLTLVINEFPGNTASVTGVSGCGATWSQAVREQIGTFAVSIWVGRTTTAGGTTVTYTSSANQTNEALLASWDGLDNTVTSWTTSTDGSVTNVTTQSTGSITPGVAAGLIVGGIGYNAIVTISDSDTPSAWTDFASTPSSDFVASYFTVASTSAHKRQTTTSACEFAGAAVLIPLATGATTGSTVLDLEWSATTATAVSTTSVVTDDADQWSIPLEWSCVASLDPVEDTTTPRPMIAQASISMPAPTLVNGRPQQPWLPTVTRSTWATSLQLVINGVDRTAPRGMRMVLGEDVHTEPYGDESLTVRFPGVTEFDDPADFGLTQLATVTLRRLDNSAVWHVIWAGEIASVEPDEGDTDPTKPGVTIQCVGVIPRLNLLKEAPPLNVVAVEGGNLLAHRFNDKRRRFNLNIGAMKVVNTGLPPLVYTGSFQPFLDEMTNYLAQLKDPDTGAQWTIGLVRPRTPVLKLVDETTVNAVVSYGAPGVNVKLSKDFTTATTAVYASGTNSHCSWMGARFPNITQGSTPTFPLGVGASFVAGDGQAGFAPFAAYLRRGQYGSIVSDDTYDARDVDNVEQFQDRAGVTVNGIVGGQTWTAAFLAGADQNTVSGAYVDTVYEKSQTRKWLYNAQGAQGAANPAFNPAVPRIEDYVPFGDNVSKELGRKSAHQIVNRSYPAGRAGTITLDTDPAGCSRFDIDAGWNIQVDNYAGGSLLVHVSRRVRNWETDTVELTVDEKARDFITSAAVHQRQTDVADLTRRQKFGRVKSKVFDDFGVWLCEDGAGEVPLMTQEAGKWNVQRVAAARQGTIERISLAFGTGLTEHILNQLVSGAPTITGPSRAAALLTTEPITPNALNNLPGLSTPLTDMADGTNPWDHNETVLTNTYGKVWVAGGPGNACGFFPDNDPGDGTDTGLSGRHEDGGSVQFGPHNHYWLWLAVWTPIDCKAGGRLYPGAPG